MVSKVRLAQGSSENRPIRGRGVRHFKGIEDYGDRRSGAKVDGKAALSVVGECGDLKTIAARSAGIWIGLSIDDGAHAALRRDGLDPAALRLTGLHPFEFSAAPDGGWQVIAHANDNETAEALLDLFRVYFLRRLLT